LLPLKEEELEAIMVPKDNDAEDDDEDEEEEEEEEDELVADELTSLIDLGRTNLEFAAKSFTGFLPTGI
jgi:hypothetical protein